jgi:hypothetical protein
VSSSIEIWHSIPVSEVIPEQDDMHAALNCGRGSGDLLKGVTMTKVNAIGGGKVDRRDT